MESRCFAVLVSKNAKKIKITRQNSMSGNDVMAAISYSIK